MKNTKLNVKRQKKEKIRKTKKKSKINTQKDKQHLIKKKR